MKVTMLVALSGPGLALDPGDVHDFEDAEATRLISARYALPYVETEIERAVDVRPIETRRRKKG